MGTPKPVVDFHTGSFPGPSACSGSTRSSASAPRTRWPTSSARRRATTSARPSSACPSTRTRARTAPPPRFCVAARRGARRYGPEAASRTAPSFAAHADNLVRALSSRPTLTDNVAALEAQAARYLDARGDAALAPGLIDSAHIARDLASPRCRAFNEALGCAWFEEIRCHSDRDQLSFPYALGALGLAAAAPARPAEDPVFVGRRGEPPLALVVPPGRPRRGEGPAFHWYYTHALAVGKCLACVKHRRDALAGDLLAVARAPS